MSKACWVIWQLHFRFSVAFRALGRQMRATLNTSTGAQSAQVSPHKLLMFTTPAFNRSVRASISRALSGRAGIGGKALIQLVAKRLNPRVQGRKMVHEDRDGGQNWPIAIVCSPVRSMTGMNNTLMAQRPLTVIGPA